MSVRAKSPPADPPFGRPQGMLTEEEYLTARARRTDTTEADDDADGRQVVGNRFARARLHNRSVTKQTEIVLRSLSGFRPKEIQGERSPETARDALLVYSQYAVEILLGIARSTLVPIGLRKAAAQSILDVGAQVLPKRVESRSTTTSESTLRIQTQDLAGVLDRLDPVLLAKVIGSAGPPALPEAVATEAAPESRESSDAPPPELHEDFAVSPEDLVRLTASTEPPAVPVRPPDRTRPLKTPEEKVLACLRKYGSSGENRLRSAMKTHGAQEGPNWKTVLDGLVRTGQIERERNGLRGGRHYRLGTGNPLPKSVPRVTKHIRHAPKASRTTETKESPHAEPSPARPAPAD